MSFSLLAIYFLFYFDKKNIFEISRFFQIKPLINGNKTVSQPMVFDTAQTTATVPTPTIFVLSVFPTRRLYPTKIIIRPTDINPTKSTGLATNFEAIKGFVANPPVIGCQTGQACDAASLGSAPLMKGIGFATYYGDESATGYNVVADVIHNWKKITMEEAKKFISDNMMTSQSNLTPSEAKATGKVIGYAATRTCRDQGKIKYLFGIDNPASPSPYFIGRVMVVDCAATGDWMNNLSKILYSYKGWSNLNWIVDLSKNSFVQLPSGVSGNKSNTGEGRPGVILVDESIVGSL